MNNRNKKTNNMQELQYRILFVLFAVVVFRIGAHIPLPGIDLDQLSQLFQFVGWSVGSVGWWLFG